LRAIHEFERTVLRRKIAELSQHDTPDIQVQLAELTRSLKRLELAS
jgi:hypothetical protein